MATFDTAITQNTTVVSAKRSGVVATRIPRTNASRASVDVPATTRTGRMRDRKSVKNGASMCPMNGAPTTIATSVGEPPIRRTTTGMNVTRTAEKTPAHAPEKTSMWKLCRTRAGCQFRSVTA